MRWYGRTKMAQDETVDYLLARLKVSHTLSPAEMLRVCEQLLVKMSPEDSWHRTKTIQAIIGCFQNNAPPRGNPASAMVRVLCSLARSSGEQDKLFVLGFLAEMIERGTTVDSSTRLEAVKEVGKFGDVAVPFIPLLMRKIEDSPAGAKGSEFDAARNSIKQIESAATDMDEKLTFPTAGETLRNWRRVGGTIRAGTKLKISPKSDLSTTFIITVDDVELRPYATKGERVNLPYIVYHTEDSNIPRKINLISSEYEVWMFKDPESMPLDKYKGLWVTVGDQSVASFASEGAKPYGQLLGREGDACTVRLIKVPVAGEKPMSWIVEVPCSTVKPTRIVDLKGLPVFESSSRFNLGDVVKPKNGTDRIVVHGLHPLWGRPYGAPSGEVIMGEPSEYVYLGRIGPDGTMLTRPHVRSRGLPQVQDEE